MKRVLFLAAAGVAGVAAAVTANRWSQEWGVDPDEAAAELPGDELVVDPTKVMTYGITIEAAPSDVWPWLLQMGFGRGGWYSYDFVDMRGRSHEAIAPELGVLAVGDTLPTHPDGGFLVRVVEPEHALVVSVDSAMAARWADEARSRRTAGPRGDTPANLRATGVFMGGTMPTEFEGSWAWVLRDLGDGRTRLIERFRVRFDGESSPMGRLGMPLVAFGVFAMLRRQMLGIRERAEQTARERRFASAEASAAEASAAEASAEEASARTGEETSPVAPAPLPA